MVIRSSLSDVDVFTNRTITDYITCAADKCPERTALVDASTGRSYTYGELKRSIYNACWALHKRGFTKGDVVCFCSQNNAEYVIMFHALISLGVIVTTINPLYTTDELKHHLSFTKSKYVFIRSNNLRRTQEAAKFCPTLKGIYTFDHSSGFDSCLDIIAQSSAAEQSRLPKVSINTEEDLAVIPTSSGTTGLPKGVMLTHKNLVASMLQLSQKDVTVFSLEHDTLVFAVPLFHIYGIALILACALNQTATVVLFDRFESASYLDAVQKYKATILPLVPPMIVLFSKHPLVDQYDLSSVRSVFFGAAPTGEESIKLLKKRIGITHISQAYGLTEMSPLITLTRKNDTKLGSVGVAVSNTELKIIDIETSLSVGNNKVGEICARGPQKMKGYLYNSKATAETIDKDGWLHTGDIGYVDEECNLFVTGRLKELIKYNAFQVAPAELENLVLTHPAVADVGVIGVPDEMAGELPRAYVVLKPGVKVTENEIYTFAAERTAPYKKLRGGVRFISEIPKNASGKILRRTLVEYSQKEQTLKSKM